MEMKRKKQSSASISDLFGKNAKRRTVEMIVNVPLLVAAEAETVNEERCVIMAIYKYMLWYCGACLLSGVVQNWKLKSLDDCSDRNSRIQSKSNVVIVFPA